MKYIVVIARNDVQRDAPHAGARIEIPYAMTLKLRDGDAPHAGARIEISSFRHFHFCASDAPHAGARIEI